MHTVKYWDSKLYQLQKIADSINYHIDSDADYLQICKMLPTSRNKPAPAEILPLFYNIIERVQSVKNGKSSQDALASPSRHKQKKCQIICRRAKKPVVGC